MADLPLLRVVLKYATIEPSDALLATKIDKLLTSPDRTGGPYVLTDADNTNLQEVDDDVTIPAGLTTGFQCTIYNKSDTIITVDASAVTVDNTVLRDIPARGVLIITSIDTDTYLLIGELL